MFFTKRLPLIGDIFCLKRFLFELKVDIWSWILEVLRNGSDRRLLFPGVPLLGAEANVSTNVSKKASPEDTCRQLVTAKKEMKILDDIIATTKNSDLQSDYDQMNANLMQKRQLLAEWVSRVPCPLANCNIHHSNVKKSKKTC
ncbi:hypothetical protein CEXT_177361 [Caerostris extrusa]|uniref:Uncharacterized protein n=1 Tax=Caerostris extrusa TaxID=172846 RepID=A0AAV4N3A5_CAEEX|nr:hypothetical protein CEXT_177361 [Caerostris extrusa]